MRHTIANYIIGGVALALAALANLKKPETQTVIQPIKQATATGKLNPYAWGELEQAEVDALQHKLEGMTKRPVIIFCSDDNCRDIALDFDNAFESARWTSEVQRPLIDSSVGIWTSSTEIAEALSDASGGRLKASILGPEWTQTDKIALAIGKKPR